MCMSLGPIIPINIDLLVSFKSKKCLICLLTLKAHFWYICDCNIRRISHPFSVWIYVYYFSVLPLCNEKLFPMDQDSHLLTRALARILKLPVIFERVLFQNGLNLHKMVQNCHFFTVKREVTVPVSIRMTVM